MNYKQTPGSAGVVNKGFPKFGLTQSGAAVTALKNYNLPDFVLAMVAKDCDSELVNRGRIDDRLQSMNDDALAMLHKVFVDCQVDEAGKYAQYRFYAYVSSMFHKCQVLVNESVPGRSGKNHKMQTAVKSSGMYVAVATNKATGTPVNKRDVARFYRAVRDIKEGEHGTMLADAVYASSVGFRDDAVPELSALSRSGGDHDENRLDFKTASFENNIYTVTRC